MVQTVQRTVWDPLSHSIKIDRRHPCGGAEAHPHRPDCSDGDRNSTGANLCASEVSLMECGHSVDFLLFVGVTEFSGGGQVASKFENTVIPVIVLSFNTFATEDVDHEAL